MTLRSFIVTVDPFSDPVSVMQFMQDKSNISGWWHHIPGTFIVLSEMGAKTITRKSFKVIGEHHFLVAEIDLRHADGYLPQDAWDWFKRREREGIGSSATAHS
jgi:hypothetical protein